MNGETMRHIAEQAELIGMLWKQIEELKKEISEFKNSEGELWVYTQKAIEEGLYLE